MSPIAALAALPLLFSLAGPPIDPPRPQIVGKAPPVLGPFLGAVGTHEASIFVRIDGGDQQVRLSVVDADGKTVSEATLPIRPEADRCVRWDVGGLEPNSSYAAVAYGERVFFDTPAEPDKPSKVTFVFGSCADDRPGIPNPVWPAIAKERPDTLVLLGDTPYIDTTELNTQRRRYMEFFSSPGLSGLLRDVPLLATWDDHDFAVDGSDGKAPGKEGSRRAFLEYHANPSAGSSAQGIYTRYRRGPADLFLLDTRWFSGTEPSFADPTKTTLLGATQWEWLKRELASSTAPFKLIVSGMVWNEAVRPSKPDQWTAYPHERAALFAYLAEKQIPGVVLVAGDLHRSRAILHPPEETGLAYSLREFISSPLGTKVIAENAVAHPGLFFDLGEPHSYLVIAADSRPTTPSLTVSFKTAAGGEVKRIDLDLRDLRPNAAVVPEPRLGERDQRRTEEVLTRAKTAAPGSVDLVFLGDSITEGWEIDGAEVWKQRYGKRKALNFGVSGDRTQHVLWRIQNGQLDGLKPKVVVVMIGTNNSNGTDHTSQEIGDGIRAVVRAVRAKCPESKVLLLAVFPRGPKPSSQRAKNDEASHLAAEIADGAQVQFLDLGSAFVREGGAIPKEIMPDYLHLSPEGYGLWAEAMEPALKKLLGE